MNMLKNLLVLFVLLLPGISLAATLTTRDGVTHERMDMFPLEPGESRTVKASFSENGFRYRCPINPTPWYEVSVNK